MNPLGQLPASTSPSGTLSSTDWLKTLRMMLIQAAGVLLTLGFKWVLAQSNLHPFILFDQDITVPVVAIVNGLLELVRRYFAGVSYPPL